MLSHEQRGQRLFVAKGCVSCHTAKSIEPIETHVGRIDIANRQLTAEYLQQFLKDPSIKKTWTDNWKMPNLNLKPAEITSLVAFLRAAQPTREVSAND